MEVESPKLISNIGLNNTNNNSECEVAQLSQSIISERLDQDSFDVVENNVQSAAKGLLCSSNVSILIFSLTKSLVEAQPEIIKIIIGKNSLIFFILKSVKF